MAVLAMLATACSATGKDKTGAIDLKTADGDTATTLAAEEAAAASAASVAAATAAAAAKGSTAQSAAGAAGPAGAKSAAAAMATQDCKKVLMIGAYNVTVSHSPVAATLGDPKLMTQAMKKWINARGGLACHPIDIVRHEHDVTGTVPQDQDDQSACAKFTEDSHVFAAVVITTVTSAFYSCMAQRRTLLFMATTQNPDSALYNDHPDLFFGVSPTTDRVAQTLAEGLWRLKYFSGKVGLVYADTAWMRTAANAFKRHAATHGLGGFVDGTICGPPCTTQEQTQEGQSVVLKFQGQRVDHVVLFDNIVTQAYTNAAQAANYLPRLAMSSNSLPEVQALLLTPTMLRDAVGVGFLPATDVEAAQDVPETPAMKECQKAMAAEGVSMDNRLALQDARHECDAFWLLKAAVDKAGRADPALMRAAVESLGASYGPAISWKAVFAPGRHEGIQTWRPIGYDVACKCWKFTGGEADFVALPGQPV
jgi:hypothetical protein